MPSCPRCNKAVYDAESVLGAGKSWHQSCYTCADCNTRLSSTTLTESKGEIYCSGCYSKNFGPKGFGIGGTSVLTGMSVSDSSSGSNGPKFCVSCGAKNTGAKFCGECGKPPGGSGASSSSSSSSNTYSKAPVVNASNSYSNKPPSPRATGQPRSVATLNSNTSSSSNSGGISNKCGKCKETVYFAEEVQGAGRKWHQSCFVCRDCKKGLSSSTLSDKDGVLYCNACYGKNFGPKGFGFSGGGAGLMTGK